MKKLFTLLMLIICLTNVKAYENNLFTIDIPSEYKEEIKENIFKWTNENKYISITISQNTEGYNIETYTDKDLERQKTYLESIYLNGLLDYNMTVEVSRVSRDKINDNSILTYEVYWPSQELTGYDIHQKGAVYTTKNYIYTILMSDEKEISDDEFTSLLKTFELKDEPITQTSSLIAFILVVGTILGIIGYFVDRKKNKKKKEHK